MGPVVVGIDGSEAAAEALRVAVEEARLRDTSVAAVHVWHAPVGEYLSGFPPDPDELERLAAAARALLARAVAGADVEAVLLERDGVGAALVDEAARREASLLVVGSRGLGPVRGLLAGSVGLYCTTHAHCPVLVVHLPAVRAIPAA